DDFRGDGFAADELYGDLVHRVNDVGGGHDLAVRNQDPGTDLMELHEAPRAGDVPALRPDHEHRGGDLTKELLLVLGLDAHWDRTQQSGSYNDSEQTSHGAGYLSHPDPRSIGPWAYSSATERASDGVDIGFGVAEMKRRRSSQRRGRAGRNRARRSPRTVCGKTRARRAGTPRPPCSRRRRRLSG